MDWTAFFTGLLVLVTFGLVLVTGGLVWVALRQLQDARVLQRAYVSALPDGISTTTRGELLAHVEFKNVGHLPASQVKSLLKFTASDDGDWSPPHVDARTCALLAFCRSGSASRLVVTGLDHPNPGRSTCMRGGGSLMWMASDMSGERIFAIATTPKSEKPKPVAAVSFAKSTVVTTNMGTMQIKGQLCAASATHSDSHAGRALRNARASARQHTGGLPCPKRSLSHPRPGPPRLMSSASKSRFLHLAPELVVTKIFRQAGPEGSGPRPHYHPWDESFYVVSGNFAFGVGDKEMIAEPGTLVHLPAGTMHWFRYGQGGGERDDLHDLT